MLLGAAWRTESNRTGAAWTLHSDAWSVLTGPRTAECGWSRDEKLNSVQRKTVSPEKGLIKARIVLERVRARIYIYGGYWNTGHTTLVMTSHERRERR